MQTAGSTGGCELTMTAAGGFEVFEHVRSWRSGDEKREQ